MAVNPAGHLIPKNSINDLYHNYALPITSSNNQLAATAAPKIATSSTSTMAAATLNNATLPMGNASAGGVGAGGAGVGFAEQSCSAAAVGVSVSTTLSVASASAMTTATALLVSLPPPSSSFATLDGVPRGKCAYFVRRQLDVALCRDNFHGQVICGDFPVHSKIDTLAILFDEILQPLLQNHHNCRLWPESVNKDLSNRMKDVRNTLVEVSFKRM